MCRGSGPFHRVLFMACLAVVAVFFSFSKERAFAQSREEQLQKRVERLENVIREYKQMMLKYEEELGAVKEEMKRRDETVDQKVQEALQKPEQEHFLRSLMENIRLTESAETPEEKQLKTLYDEGFYLKGADDQLRIGGWVQVDSRWYLNSDHPRDNTFLIRRARLDLRGVLENDWAYRLYGTLIGERNGILQEGWLEYRKYGSFRVRSGQVFEPFSLEAVYSARWTDFIERAMIVSAVSPQEDIGIMVFGKVLNHRLTYAFGFFNGQGRNTESTVDDKDFTTRVTFNPFLHSSNYSLLKDLYIGGSFATGNNEVDLSGSDFRTQGFTPFFDFQPGVSQDGRVTRWGLELEYILRSFNLKTEYLAANYDEIRMGDLSGNLKLHGFYVNAGYLLTGEDFARDANVSPAHPFDPSAGGWGAFQVAARYQTLATNDDLLNSGMARGSDKAQSVTVGLNWYPNRHIRFQFNYDHAWFGETITVSGKSLDSEDTFMTRFLYDF